MSESQIGTVLQKIPYGVAVVTVGRGGVENGLTVSWMSQVSFEPPQLMVAVARVHYSEEFVRSTKGFVVNLLKADQKKLAGQFAREAVAGESKLDRVATRASASGPAILEDALAWIECSVAAIHEAGDHLMVVGNVEDAGILNEGEPMTSASSGMRYLKSKPRKHK